MNLINQQFQDYIAKKAFYLDRTETAEQVVYKGKLMVHQWPTISFAIQISNHTDGLFQIVFYNLGNVVLYHQRQMMYERLNQINVEQGLLYAFCLDHDGQIFARHIGYCTSDVEAIYQTVTIGMRLMKTILPQLILDEDATVKGG